MKVHKLIKNLKGFTLIELLIVIAIIGVLSALLMSNFIGVRQRARDAQRKSDLRQIQSSLELYRSDNGDYPTTTDINDLVNCDGKFGNSPDCTTYYLQKLPTDPLYPDWTYSYTSSSGSDYTLFACLENGSDSQADRSSDGSLDTNENCTTASYTVTNP